MSIEAYASDLFSRKSHKTLKMNDSGDETESVPKADGAYTAGIMRYVTDRILELREKQLQSF